MATHSSSSAPGVGALPETSLSLHGKGQLPADSGTDRDLSVAGTEDDLGRQPDANLRSGRQRGGGETAPCVTVGRDRHKTEELERPIMTDLVERLRKLADKNKPEITGEYWNACEDAADEIERLRFALAECAAEWSSPPGTVMTVAADVWTEFQRRAQIAHEALER